MVGRRGEGRKKVGGRWDWGLTAGRLKGNSWDDEKLLKMNCGNGGTA